VPTIARPDDFLLSCPECGSVRALSPADQRKILASLVRLSQSLIVECACRKYQFIVAARPIRAPRRLGGSA